MGYAGKSGTELLNGTLNIKNCTVTLARKLRTWCLPVPGLVALLTALVDDVDVLGAREAASASLREQRHILFEC